MKPNGRTKQGEATRQALLDLIADRGGLHISELARLLGASHTNVRHHLTRLRRDGAIRPFREGRRVHWFSADVAARHHFGLSVLQEDSVAEAMKRLRAAPGLSLTGLAEELDVSPKVAGRVIRRLEDAGFVRHRGRGYVLQPERLPYDEDTF